MSEFEWLYGADPLALLAFLRNHAARRKLLLFVCASLRDGGRAGEAELVGRFADGRPTEADLIAAPDRQWSTAEDAWHEAFLACGVREDAYEQRQRRCAWLHDLFGNPFRPHGLDAAWLRWNDGAVRKMVRAIYEDGRFAELPLLADALEEAGCADAFLLHHCRHGGGHVRGCWAVDLLSGRDAPVAIGARRP